MISARGSNPTYLVECNVFVFCACQLETTFRHTGALEVAVLHNAHLRLLPMAPGLAEFDQNLPRKLLFEQGL